MQYHSMKIPVLVVINIDHAIAEVSLAIEEQKKAVCYMPFNKRSFSGLLVAYFSTNNAKYYSQILNREREKACI